jgi:hypothetical protein
MASIRHDRGALMPGSVPGHRAIVMLVAALAVVLVAIGLVFNVSRRQASGPSAGLENVSPGAGLLAAAAPQPAPAAVPVSADEDAASARKQAAISRAVKTGRPGLAACYQRALIKDDSLVHGKVTVRVALAPSGRVETVGVDGPAAFRAMRPCLEKTIAKWNFPTATAAYVTEFPLVLQGSL